MFENIYVIWIKNSIYFKWLLYTGKSENNNLSNIIYKLCMNYEGENYCLYIDRYYTSINALINIKNGKIKKDVFILTKF